MGNANGLAETVEIADPTDADEAAPAPAGKSKAFRRTFPVAGRTGLPPATPAVRADVLTRLTAYLSANHRLTMGDGQAYSVIPAVIRRHANPRSVSLEFELSDRPLRPADLADALRRGAEPDALGGVVRGDIDGFPTPVFAYSFERAGYREIKAFEAFARSMHASISSSLTRLRQQAAAGGAAPVLVHAQ